MNVRIDKRWWRKPLYRVAAMMMFFAATCSFFACSSGEDSPYNPVYAQSRTVMVYMAVENNLSGSAASDVAEMLVGMADKGLYPNDRLVIFIDDVGMPRIYVVDRTTTATLMTQLTPVKTYEGEVNSASADVLGEFVAYTKQHYPADSYGLVLGSHASGWIPSNYLLDMQEAVASRRSFGVDNGINSSSPNLNGRQMNIPDMAHALEQQGGVDYLLIDACLMQSVEVAYELRHAAKHIVSSPAEIPGPGANYKTMVPAMFMATNCETKMLQAYYQEYCNKPNWGIVVSEVSTVGLDAYASFMKTVVDKYRAKLLDADYDKVLNYFKYDVGSWGTDVPDCFDMQGVMKNVLSEEDYAAWLQEVAKVVTCMHSDFWYSGARGGYRTYTIDAEQCCGVTMFVPLSKYEGNRYKYNETFCNMAWSKDVWGEN